MRKFLPPLPTAQYYANAVAIYNGFIANPKFPHLFACAMVTMADAEASLNPLAVGDKDEAFGLWQLHASRCAAILYATGVDIHKLPPIADQLKGVIWELMNVENAAYRAILAQTTAYDAGSTACTKYERPSHPGDPDTRGQRCVWWDGYFTSQNMKK